MKHCAYCQRMRPAEGFKKVLHAESRTQRGMCLKCQEVRKLPREELELLAKTQREERKKS